MSPNRYLSLLMIILFCSPGALAQGDSVCTGTIHESAPEFMLRDYPDGQQSDIIGIYFEQTGQVNAFQTTVPYEQVTAYLMVVNPSVTAAGIQGWECCVQMTGPAIGLSFELAGQAINFETTPCFTVGMTSYPLMGDNPVTLATIQFLQPSPDDVTQFYIHPTAQPSISGLPCYLVGLNPSMLVPLGWQHQDESLPVAFVNEDPLAGVDAPPAAVEQLNNYPNPFNPSTTISFVLGAEAPVRLFVYDIGGRIVRTLLDGQSLQAGRQEVAWNGRDESGRNVAAGVYFYRLETGSFSQTKRMTLLK